MIIGRNRLALLAGAVMAVLVRAGAAPAASAEVFMVDGLANRGFDVVAYFQEGAPREGRVEFTVKWHGAMWRFANAQNMEAFEMNPRAYAPSYGGYCAYAMAKGKVSTSVPEAWSIVDGKLYLNYSVAVRSLWRRDSAGFIRKADAAWPEALGR